MGVLRRAAKQQWHSAAASPAGQEQLLCMQELSPAHSQHHIPSPSTRNLHQQQKHQPHTDKHWMLFAQRLSDEHGQKHFYLRHQFSCICSNLPRILQCSNTALQLWARVGTAKHSLCHKTQEFILRLWESLKYLLCCPPKHQNWECPKRWQHQAPSQSENIK